jgi:hypothetical protein
MHANIFFLLVVSDTKITVKGKQALSSSDKFYLVAMHKGLYFESRHSQKFYQSEKATGLKPDEVNFFQFMLSFLPY